MSDTMTPRQLLQNLLDGCGIEDDDTLCNGAGDAHWITDANGERHYLTGRLLRAALVDEPAND